MSSFVRTIRRRARPPLGSKPKPFSWFQPLAGGPAVGRGYLPAQPRGRRDGWRFAHWRIDAGQRRRKTRA